MPLLLAGGMSTAQAQTWIGGDSSGPANWFVDGNWVGGAVPDGTGFFVVIDTTGPNAPTVADQLTNGIAVGAGFLHVGRFGTGALTVEDGGLVNVADEIYIGGAANSDGTVTVKGVHTSGMEDHRSTLDVDENLYVGLGGTGALTVEDGGLVNTKGTTVGALVGSDGTVTVKGVHTSGMEDHRSTMDVDGNLYVGFSGTGALTVEDGGLVNVASFAAIGLSPADGAVTVKGVHTSGMEDHRSTLDVDDILYVGIGGTGALTVEDGGLVNVAGRAAIGSLPGDGMVTVKGVHTGGTQDYHSTLDVEDTLTVGDVGTGVLTVEDGGLVDVAGSAVVGGKSGSEGTVNIGAAFGNPATAPGFFNAPSVAFGDGSGTVVFNHTDETGTYQFVPDMTSGGTGTHAILHEAGWTGLTGDGSGFAGTTSIDGGILSAGGFLGGTVDVNSGGTLAGAGVLSGPVNVKGGSTIAPGNSIGTINVADIVLDAGSTYDVEIDADGNSDLIDASGTATINGGTVAVSGTAGTNTIYRILTADGGLAGAGEFDALTGRTDTLFVTNTLSYDPNNVYLSSLVTSAFCDYAETANRRAVACGGLDTLPPTSDLAQAVLALTTPENARAAYDALSGEIHPSLKSALLNNSQQKINAINNRTHAAFSNTDTQTSTAAFGNLSSLADGNRGFWITGYGSWSDTDATAGTVQMDNDLGGVVFGIDREASDNWRFGVLGGYSRTDVAQSVLLSSGSADTWSLGLYGGAEAGATGISFGGIHNWHSIDAARTASFPGFSEYLVASYDARSWQLFAEAGHKVQLGKTMLEPFGGISHISLDTDGYSETGGSAALTALPDTQNTTFTTLGMRSSMQLADMIQARGMIGWRHAFGDTDPTSVFTISGSNPFTVTGAPIAQHAFVTELGLEAGLSESAFIAAAYNGQYGNGTTAHGFNASMRANF